MLIKFTIVHRHSYISIVANFLLQFILHDLKVPIILVADLGGAGKLCLPSLKFQNTDDSMY